MNLKEKALLLAQEVHKNQKYGIFPYMYHIYSVVEIMEDLGYSGDVVIAGILHDVLEDSDLSYNDIYKNFGRKIADIVYAVTDELGKNRFHRKRKTYPKIAANGYAVIVKVCDRIANVKFSMEIKSKMLDMYYNEHDEFVKALYKEDCELDENNNPITNEDQRAWDKLNKLVEYGL